MKLFKKQPHCRNLLLLLHSATSFEKAPVKTNSAILRHEVGRKNNVMLTFPVLLELDVALLQLNLNLAATKSEMKCEVKPAVLRKFHSITFGKNIPKVVVKPVKVFFPDSFVMLDKLLDSIRLVLLQNTVENSVAFLKLLSFEDVERSLQGNRDMPAKGCTCSQVRALLVNSTFLGSH